LTLYFTLDIRQELKLDSPRASPGNLLHQTDFVEKSSDWTSRPNRTDPIWSPKI